ncbi:MAG: T9SS type A sorting domain-containing protein [Bacteroidales bacterium]|nr:T9SS type A sorting domain-containing protein [Bacteroidales bacterium]
MRKISTFLMFFVLLVWGSQINGQINISVGNSISENFNIGTDAVSTMPTNWKVDKNNAVRTLGSYSAALSATEQSGGNLMSTTAANGIYNFAAGDAATETDRAIGGISSGSKSKSVNVYTQLKNNGLTEIPDFTISYNVEKYRNGSNATGFSIQMYYSTDGTAWTSAGNDFLSSFVADADNEGYAAAPGSVVSVTSKTLPVALAADGVLYLAWNYSVTSGLTTSNAQALGIDDVSITANGSSLPLEDFDVTFNVIGTHGILTASVDAVDITSPASVQEGKDVVFSATPDAGYQVKEWKLNSVVVDENTSNTYTLSNIAANAIVNVEFKEIPTTTYAVTYAVVNGNGNLTATVDDVAITSPADVLEGKDVVFTAVPAVGYQVKEWKLNTAIVSGNTTNNFTLTNVTSVSDVSVEFEAIPTYAITFTVKDALDVDITNAVITFDGVANPAGDYVFNNIAAGTYDYSVVAPSYQSALVSGFVVTETTTIAVVLQNQPIASLPINYSGPWKNSLPDGWTQTGLGNDYAGAAARFDNSGVNMMVQFDETPGTLSYTIKANTSGPWSGVFDVEESADGIVWTSVKKYETDGELTGVLVTENFNLLSTTRNVKWTYTTKGNGNIALDDVIITEPSPLEDFDVTFNVIGINGTLTASVDAVDITSPASVQEGKDVVFTATPDVGYQVKEWKLNGTVITENTENTYTLLNLAANANVSVEFEEIPTTTYAVTFAVIDGNGSLTAAVSGTQITSPASVLIGKNVVFTAVPDAGFQVKEWKLNGIVVDDNTSLTYTLMNLQADANVSIEFEAIPTYTITFTVKDALNVDITNAVITFNGLANPVGDYVFNNIAAGTYDYSVDAPSYQSVLVNGFVVTETATIAVVLQNEPIASLPIDYSGPWQNGLPAGWTQTGLGTDYSAGAAKFDSSGDMLKVHFDQEPGLLIYSIKGNTSGSVSWDGTFEIMESVDGSTWTSVESYSGIGEIDHTAYTSFTHNLLPTTRIVKWVYTEKITGNVGLENVIITLPLQDFDVTFDVVGAHGTLSATVDAAPITSPASVQEGKDVVFTAVPAVDYQVKEWKLNNVVVSANTSNTYTLSALNADADVSVEFEAIPEPITHVVNFSVVGANGTLIAKVEGVEISTGDLVEEGNDVVFTATPENGYRVKEWTLNSTIVPANTSNEYTVTNIMSETNVNVEFELDGTGISENNSIFLSIYPNPSNGVFTIDSDGLYTLEVLDMQGRLMVRRSLENGLNVLDMNAFANGIYLVRVNNANQVYTTRISKSE